MAAIYSNVGNRWNILGFNFTKRDALSSVYQISMALTYWLKCGPKTFQFRRLARAETTAQCVQFHFIKVAGKYPIVDVQTR
jgi:hypothetical protein